MGYKPKTEDTSHWYSRTGASVHQVPMKTDATRLRNTTITDARKMNLLPSVSNYLNVVANEGLNQWKMGQIAITAATLGRQAGEEDETFADRIIHEAMSYTRSKADFGVGMHAAIEDYLLGGILPSEQEFPVPQVLEFWPPVQEWLDNNIDEVVASEYVVVNSRGYAGQVDLKVQLKGEAAATAMMTNPNFEGRIILDYKTRNHKDNEPMPSHEREVWQGAAYSAADPCTHEGGKLLPFANLYISSRKSGVIRFLPYTEAEMEEALRAFGHIMALWKIIKGYDASF